MTVSLTIHEIGRTGHPDATVTTMYPTREAASQALHARFDSKNLRGGPYGGTAGSVTGRVFQASHVWSITEVVDR